MIIRPTTKELLAASLKELSAQKSVDKITVREIAQNCGFTAKTFYNHFRDKYELIEWIYSTAVEKIMRNLGVDGCEWRDVVRGTFQYFLDNREFLKNLTANTSGQDSFINYVAQFSVKIFSEYITRTQNWDELPRELEIFVRIYCYGIVCTFCEFLTAPIPVSDEEFVALIEQALPEPLKKYLYKNPKA